MFIAANPLSLHGTPLMLNQWQAAFYELPTTVACGPIWSAVISGFVVFINGRPFITPAGERYLDKAL